MRIKIFTKAFFLLAPFIVGSCATVTTQKAEAEEYCQKTRTAKTVCIKPENVSCEFLRKPDRVDCIAYGVLESLSGTKSDWSSADDIEHNWANKTVTCWERDKKENMEIPAPLTCNAAKKFDILQDFPLKGPAKWRSHLRHTCIEKRFISEPNMSKFKEIYSNEITMYIDQGKKEIYYVKVLGKKLRPGSSDYFESGYDAALYNNFFVELLPAKNGRFDLDPYVDNPFVITDYQLSGTTAKWREKSLREDLLEQEPSKRRFDFDRLTLEITSEFKEPGGQIVKHKTRASCVKTYS